MKKDEKFQVPQKLYMFEKSIRAADINIYSVSVKSPLSNTLYKVIPSEEIPSPKNLLKQKEKFKNSIIPPKRIINNPNFRIGLIKAQANKFLNGGTIMNLINEKNENIERNNDEKVFNDKWIPLRFQSDYMNKKKSGKIFKNMKTEDKFFIKTQPIDKAVEEVIYLERPVTADAIFMNNRLSFLSLLNYIIIGIIFIIIVKYKKLNYL